MNRRFLTDSGLVLMPEVLDLVVGCDERIFVTLYIKESGGGKKKERKKNLQSISFSFVFALGSFALFIQALISAANMILRPTQMQWLTNTHNGLCCRCDQLQ